MLLSLTRFWHWKRPMGLKKLFLLKAVRSWQFPPVLAPVGNGEFATLQHENLLDSWKLQHFVAWFLSRISGWLDMPYTVLNCQIADEILKHCFFLWGTFTHDFFYLINKRGLKGGQVLDWWWFRSTNCFGLGHLFLVGWRGKRAPIKVHHPDRVLFNGCKDLLIFFETGWEKEAWCQVLRATAGASTSTIHRTRRDYQAYTHQVEAHMPYVNKFFTGLGNKNQFSNVHKSYENKSPNVVAGVSRRRTIWRKLTSRTFKPSNAVNSQGNDYGTIQEQEGEIASIDDAGSTANGTDGTQPNNASIADHDKITITNQKDEDEEPKTLSAEPKLTTVKEIQQGLICLNMVVSRLYFDFHKSPARMASIQRFFQVSSSTFLLFVFIGVHWSLCTY